MNDLTVERELMTDVALLKPKNNVYVACEVLGNLHWLC